MILSLRVPGRLLVGPYVVLLIAPFGGNLRSVQIALDAR